MANDIENRLKMLQKENPFLERHIKRLESLKKATSRNFNEGQYTKLISLHKMINKKSSRSKIKLSLLETLEAIIKKLHNRYDKYDRLTKPNASIDLTSDENTTDILILSDSDSEPEIVEISDGPQRLSPVADTDRPSSSNAVKNRDDRNGLGRLTQMRRSSTHAEVSTGVDTPHLNTKEIKNANEEDTRTHFRKTQRVGTLGQYITHYDSNGNQLPILLCEDTNENIENQHQNSTSGKDLTAISPEDQWSMFATSDFTRRQSSNATRLPTTTTPPPSREQPSLTELLEKLRQSSPKPTLDVINENTTAQPLRNITKRRATLSADISNSEDNDWPTYERYGGEIGSTNGIDTNTTAQPLRNEPIRRQSFSYADNNLDSNRYNASIPPTINYNDPRIRIAHMPSTVNNNRPSIYQQYANRQTVPNQQYANRLAVPTQQYVNTQTVPTQQYVNTQTVPTPQYVNTQSVPAQQYVNTQTVPTPQYVNTQTVPTQQYANTQTVPTQQYANTQTVPAQQYANTQYSMATVPAQMLMPTTVLMPTAVPLSNVLCTHQQDYYNLSLRQDPRLRCGVYSQCPNAANVTGNVAATARTQPQQPSQPRTYLEYKQARARAEALQKERQLEKSRLEYSRQQQKEQETQQNNNCIHREPAHGDGRANYPKDIPNVNKEQVEKITKSLGQLDTLVNYLEKRRSNEEAGQTDVNTANVEHVAEKTVEPSLPRVDNKNTNDDETNDELLEIMSKQPLAKDKSTERRRIDRPKSVNRIEQSQKKAQHRAIATKGMSRRGQNDKSNKSELQQQKDTQQKSKESAQQQDDEQTETPMDSVSENDIMRSDTNPAFINEYIPTQQNQTERSEQNMPKDVRLTIKPFRIRLKRMNLALLKSQQLHSNKRKHSELEAAESEDEQSLRVRAKRASTKNDLAIANELDVIKFNDEAPIIALKNDQPLWHSMSKWTKVCIICDIRDRTIATHYIQQHAEYYSARLLPNILKNLKQGQMNRPTHIVAGNVEKCFYRCPFCLNAKSWSMRSWFEHFLKHTGEYKYQCTKCRLPENRLATIRTHVKTCGKNVKLIKHNIPCLNKLSKVEAHVCHLCNYIQLCRSNLDRHFVQQHGYKKDVAAILGYKVLLLTLDNVPIESKKNATELEKELSKRYEREFLIINAEAAEEGQKGMDTIKQEDLDFLCNDDIDDEVPVANELLSDVADDDNDDEAMINAMLTDDDSDDNISMTFDDIKPSGITEIFPYQDSNQESKNEKTEPAINVKLELEQEDSQKEPKQSPQQQHEQQTEKPINSVSVNDIMRTSTNPTDQTIVKELELQQQTDSQQKFKQSPQEQETNEYIPPQQNETGRPTVIVEVGKITDESRKSQEQTQKVSQNEVEKAATSQPTTQINKCPQVQLEKGTVVVNKTGDEWIDMELFLGAKSMFAGISNDTRHLFMSTTVKDREGNRKVPESNRFQTIQVRRLPGDCLSCFKENQTTMK